MKYCKNCQVNAHKQLQNCPLCGKFLDSHNDNENCEIYKGIEPFVERPVIKLENKTNFLQTKFNKLLILVMLLSVVINLVLTPTLIWSAYIVIGGTFVMFCVVLPIAEKIKLQRQIKIDLFVLTVTAIALELTVTKLFFEWYVMFEILPWIYIAAIVLLNFLIIFRRYEDKGLFGTLIFATIFAIAPQVCAWILLGLGLIEELPLKLFVIFFAVLLNLAAVLIICTRSVKEEIQRNYNL